MPLSNYRIWITTRPLRERYVLCNTMSDVVKWLLTKRKQNDKWGIEKFTNDNFVDAFYSDDLKSLFNALIR